MDFYRVGPEPGDLVLVDTPGYGVIGKSEWGAQFDHYLETRGQSVFCFQFIMEKLNSFCFNSMIEPQIEARLRRIEHPKRV